MNKPGFYVYKHRIYINSEEESKQEFCGTKTIIQNYKNNQLFIKRKKSNRIMSRL